MPFIPHFLFFVYLNASSLDMDKKNEMSTFTFKGFQLCARPRSGVHTVRALIKNEIE